MLRQPSRRVEERMLSEYVAENLQGVETVTHLRVGAPPGLDPSSPGYEMERRFYLPALPEADLVYREGSTVWILEFGVWRPQTKLGQLQLYGQLLPETPGYLDVTPDQIRLRIVVGREEPMVSRVAGLQGVDVEVWIKPWLLEILAERTGTQS
jgi:hypothetical protein